MAVWVRALAAKRSPSGSLLARCSGAVHIWQPLQADDQEHDCVQAHGPGPGCTCSSQDASVSSAVLPVAATGPSDCCAKWICLASLTMDARPEPVLQVAELVAMLCTRMDAWGRPAGVHCAQTVSMPDTALLFGTSITLRRLHCALLRDSSQLRVKSARQKAAVWKAYEAGIGVVGTGRQGWTAGQCLRLGA